jgi:hypothetical protein
MFQPVAELLSVYDMLAPIPSYTDSFADWKDDAEAAVDSIHGVMELGDSEAAKQIGFQILEKFIRKGRAVGWSSQTAEVRSAEVERILALPQIPQRTPEWYKQGKNVLTASEFSNLYGTPRAVRQLAFQKVAAETSHTNRLACRTCEMGPFDWGIRFEPIVKMLMEEGGVKIVDSGRLVHPTNPKLAASPDGLILEATDPSRVGRLVEIKCPISREMNETIPFEYWCQMQIQMEVTGIEECEYVEVKIESRTKTMDVSGGEFRSLWLFQDEASCVMYYAYTEEERAAMESKNYTLVETIPWRLGKMFTAVVVRDRGWFQTTETMQKEFWAIVDQARNGVIQPDVKKARVNVIKEGCLITD